MEYPITITQSCFFYFGVVRIQVARGGKSVSYKEVDLEGHIYQFKYRQYKCMVCEKVLFLYSADSEDEGGEGSIIHLLSMDYLFLCEALI